MTDRREHIFSGLLVGLTFGLITLSAGILKQELPVVVPLYISLVVMLLQSRANRLTFLLGGLNSLLYAAVYIYTGLYAMAADAALVSFPLQMLTFHNWKR